MTGPFDRYTLAVSSALSAIVLWEARLPGFYYLGIIAYLYFLWVGIFGVIGLRLTLSMALASRLGRPSLSRGWSGVMLLPAVATTLIALKLPLHVGFTFARPTLDQVIEQDLKAGDSFPISKAGAGPYSIFQQALRRCHDKSRIYFRLSNDSESGFVYSTDGIEDLCYNSGSKGHLSGNWYWFSED